MKTPHFAPRRRAMLLAGVLSGATQLASAVDLGEYVTTPSQWGTGSAFYHGHTAWASTNYNNLSAGGSFTVQCNHPATLPMSGERTLSSSTLGIKQNKLTVTIPAQQPALRNISGWLQIPGDTHLSCNYRWTTAATESGYTIGAGGISFQVGNGTVRHGGTVDFHLYRPPHEDADGGCTP